MNWSDFKKEYEDDVVKITKTHFHEIANCPIHIDWDTMEFIINDVPDNFTDEAKYIIAHQNMMLSKVKKPD